MSEAAICDGTRVPLNEHAKALLKDGGDLSVITGSKLIGILDAGCNFKE